jgi:hypothetical protein
VRADGVPDPGPPAAGRRLMIMVRPVLVIMRVVAQVVSVLHGPQHVRKILLQHLDISQPDAAARLLHLLRVGQAPADDAEAVADRAGQRGLLDGPDIVRLCEVALQPD